MTNNETTLERGKSYQKRIHADDRLDALFMREMRCPYCQTKMPKGTSKCRTCGLSKEQIYYAKLTAPYKPGSNVLMSKVRPAELPMWKMAVGGVFGFLGVHCLIAKRYLRGLFYWLLLIAFVVELCVFPPDFGEGTSSYIRSAFENHTYLFPGDLIGIILFGLWVWDMFAIFLRQFKYPVVVQLSEEE
ncbi:MAG: hypothetical protein KIG16_02620 [Eubacteriales bacterium]|nr:hypothetical protein [Eubacteriales bacterium]